MNEVESLHREAMELAEEAALTQAEGNISKAKELYAAALDKERRAAEQLDTRHELEPTRGVLFRSAASLALDCGDTRTAEKLVARGLAGDPPAEIAGELRDLLEQVYFQRHLDIRGVVLEPHDFQMSIAGTAVGLGLADSEVFVGRIQDIEKLIYRTAERQASRPFRERGRRDKALTREVGVYISVPRAASLAVTFRIGYSKQLQLPGMDIAGNVISEFLDCMEALGSGAAEEMVKRIPDPAYRRNFLALGRRIATDGDAVQTVGFTTAISGKERRVLLTRTMAQLSLPTVFADERDTGKQVTIRGTLKFADSTKADTKEIRIVDAEGRRHRIRVPEGMMDDIVRPLWDFDVEVTGIRQRGLLVLKDIIKAQDSDETKDDG